MVKHSPEDQQTTKPSVTLIMKDQPFQRTHSIPLASNLLGISDRVNVTLLENYKSRIN